MKGTLATLAVIGAVALAGCDGVEVSIGGDDGGAAESVTSTETEAQVREALLIYDADLSLATNRAEACELKVEAGQYFDYNECYAAEIRPAAIEAEEKGKAILAGVGEASPKCRKEIDRTIQSDWLIDNPSDLGPVSESPLLLACRSGD